MKLFYIKMTMIAHKNSKHLISETWSSGNSKTLNTPQTTMYIIFRDGRKIITIESITFPAKIGGEHVNIQSHIFVNDILLPFSWSSMKKKKKIEMKINFQNDIINAFGEDIPLITTSSSHYVIPLTSAKQAINNIDRENNSAFTLTINNINGQPKQAIALKLH